MCEKTDGKWNPINLERRYGVMVVDRSAFAVYASLLSSILCRLQLHWAIQLILWFLSCFVSFVGLNRWKMSPASSAVVNYWDLHFGWLLLHILGYGRLTQFILSLMLETVDFIVIISTILAFWCLIIPLSCLRFWPWWQKFLDQVNHWVLCGTLTSLVEVKG